MSPYPAAGDAGNSRQSPPDYTQRNVKLRLFTGLAALMLLAGIAERAFDPGIRRWLTGLGQPAEYEGRFDNRLEAASLRTAHDPAGTIVAAADSKKSADSDSAQPFDPVRRAWEQGWRDILDHLSAEQQDLLFELVNQSAAHKSVEENKSAAELAPHIQRQWDDYHAAAFQAVADLKGDDQALWINVLREVNSRFNEKTMPALRAIAEGAALNAEHKTALHELETALVALARAQIQDDTVVFRPAERQIWFRELARVGALTAEQLHAGSVGRVAYLQLYKQSADYRGKMVTVKGTVRLAYRVAAPANYLGVKEYCVYWLYPAGGPDSPLIVYALHAPPGFPTLPERDRGGRKLREDVEVTGVFMKRAAYPAAGGTYTAPLLLANTPDWQPQPQAVAKMPFTFSELAAAGLAMLVFALCVTAVLWKRSTAAHRRRQAERSGGLVNLGPLEVGPSPREQLRQFEQQAQGDKHA